MKERRERKGDKDEEMKERRKIKWDLCVYD